jgi:hypothetical protein
MSRLLGGVISELVLILLNLDFEIEFRKVPQQHIHSDQSQILSTQQLLFVLSFVKGCVHLKIF